VATKTVARKWGKFMSYGGLTPACAGTGRHPGCHTDGAMKRSTAYLKTRYSVNCDSVKGATRRELRY